MKRSCGKCIQRFQCASYCGGYDPIRKRKKKPIAPKEGKSRAELKRLHVETAERVVCRRLDSRVGGSCDRCIRKDTCAETKAEDCPWLIHAGRQP
jgi:hypothetical protein